MCRFFLVSPHVFFLERRILSSRDVRVQILIWFQTFFPSSQNPTFRLLMELECIEKHIFSGNSDYFRLFLTDALTPLLKRENGVITSPCSHLSFPWKPSKATAGKAYFFFFLGGGGWGFLQNLDKATHCNKTEGTFKGARIVQNTTKVLCNLCAYFMRREEDKHLKCFRTWHTILGMGLIGQI